jgi:predicted N-acetyltransferase YhbS
MRRGSTVRPATSRDHPAIAALLDRTFGARPYADRLSLWDWRYDRNPARTGDFPSFLVAEENARIVGVQGLIPLRIRAGTRELCISCSCDLAVDPSARSAGMKLKLAALSEEVSALHLSTSANVAAGKITVALGGTEVAAGRRKWILPLKASRLLVRRWAVGGRGRRAAAAVLKPLDWIMNAVQTARAELRRPVADCGDVAEFDARFDRLWERLAVENTILTVRDAAYLNWRYARYPFRGIRSFERSRGKELLGFGVLHTAVDEDGIGFAAILELAGDDVRGDLLAEAVRRAAAAGAHYVIARCSPVDEDLFRKAGFQPRDLPHSPVTYKNNSDVAQELFANDRNWYLTLGDGDVCHYYGGRPAAVESRRLTDR